MEKKTTLQDNRNAQQWTVNAGFYSTIIQFIIGMPGESPETINETLEFSKWAYTLNENLNPLIFSINYAQALPGTPLYEYGRKLKLIGRDIDSEEEYLIFVSDRDAADVGSVVNFTDYPMAVLLLAVVFFSSAPLGALCPLPFMVKFTALLFRFIALPPRTCLTLPL